MEIWHLILAKRPRSDSIMEIWNAFLKYLFWETCIKWKYFQEYTLFSLSRCLYLSTMTAKHLLMQWETQSNNLGEVYMGDILVSHQLLWSDKDQTTEEAKTRFIEYDRTQQKKFGVYQNCKNSLLFKECDSLKRNVFLINEMCWLH